MASLHSALKFLSLPNACPLCIVALNPQTGQAIAVNSTFESIFGPLYKFKEWDFANAACEDEVKNPNEGGDDENKKLNRSKFREAIGKVRTSLCDANADHGGINTKMDEGNEKAAAATGKIRNVEMLTLGSNDAGLPIKKHFDWTIGSVQLDGGDDNDDTPASAVILYGDLVNEEEESDRARDRELIDFFQNAPIAMHWLNGNGIVLWANQTELNVLGYTPEEYIGQPIMNFCPDEQELVLEIFKQLGSGNTIADVPVRFRTKDGKLVHLLIDSNVAYNPDGSFGHTRCFIRDDTARKIRDARTKLLLEENERSLRMLDSFLSKTLHHVMGPLHALRGTCEIVSDTLQLHNSIDGDEREKNCDLLERAAETVTTTTRMVADVSDLARFDEGATLQTKFNSIGLREIGLEAINNIRFNHLRLTGGDDGISVSLNLVGEGGPGAINTDRAALLRVLAHLLENAVREVDKGGTVSLQMTSASSNDGSNNVLIEVIDNGRGLPSGTCLDQGDNIIGTDTSPAPCHRYLIGGKRENSNDPDELQKVRAQMEEGLRDLKQNGVGVGLPLSYHLVRVLGGDLRHEKLSKGTRIWFSLPNKLGDVMVDDTNQDKTLATLKTEKVVKKGLPPAQITFTSKNSEEPIRKRKRIQEDPEFGNFVSSEGSMTSGDDTVTTRYTSPAPMAAEPAAVAVAKCGVKASMPFSVLIVEDTNICARLLAMQLKKMKCTTQRAENGRIAVDLLEDAMPGTFDMVLMDLRMPVMDGLEATKLIRNELGIKDLPIVALTGEMSDGVRSECEGLGFTEFFQKPLPKKRLQELITKYTALRDGTE